MMKCDQISIQNILKYFREYYIKEHYAYEDKLAIINLHGGLESVFNDRVFLFKDSVSFLYTRSGTAEVQINEITCTMTTDTIIDILDTDIIQNINFSPEYEGILIFMSLSFFYELLENISLKANEGLFNRMSSLCIKMTSQESEIILQTIKNMIIQFDRKEHSDYYNLIKTFALIFFLEFRNISASYRFYDKNVKIAKEDIITNFTLLLAENCKEQHEVRWYANELCIDPVYFSRLLKSVNGKTANQWIDEAIIRQSKIYLNDNNITIKHIAEILNFSDQAAFSKFFKKHTGISPSDYQKDISLKNKSIIR